MRRGKRRKGSRRRWGKQWATAVRPLAGRRGSSSHGSTHKRRRLEVHINTFVRSRRRVALAGTVVFAVTALTALALVAGTARGSSRDTITLHVGLFGDFGYHDLYKQYEASHPNIDIKEDISSYADHHANLAKHLATNGGADDIESVEVGFISQFKSEPQYFVDLRKYGATKLKNRWLPWKWAQSIAPNGAQIGLGTDVGSLAMCYR